jgi:hypothetical protein
LIQATKKLLRIVLIIKGFQQRSFLKVVFGFWSASMDLLPCPIDAHGGRGAPQVSPIKIFEKLSHKNAIKHNPPP